MKLYSNIDTSHLNTADSFRDPCIVPWEINEEGNKTQQQQKKNLAVLRIPESVPLSQSTLKVNDVHPVESFLCNAADKPSNV